MSNRASILSTVLANPIQQAGEVSRLLPGRPPLETVEEPSRQRTRIWDLHHSLYCSIIGTCLTTAELRAILLRLDVHGAQAADDHGIHQLGVKLVSGPRTGSKHLQKALDRRHKVALNQCAKAKDAAAVAAFWDDAVKRGDIPSAYWAVLTHPATTHELVKRVFGEVHMLSHLVGAANRADIRRLRQLEEETLRLRPGSSASSGNCATASRRATKPSGGSRMRWPAALASMALPLPTQIPRPSPTLSPSATSGCRRRLRGVSV
jgi:hypothetical protein